MRPQMYYTATDVMGWNVSRVVEFAKSDVGLDDDDAKILRANKFNGESLLNLTEDKLVRAGLMMGPATILATAIAKLHDKAFTLEPFTLMLKCGGGKRGKLMPYTFTSSEDFAKFAFANPIYVVSGYRMRPVRLLSDAQKLADGEFLKVSISLEERVGILEGNVKSTSSGHEHTTTQAIAQSPAMRKQFGELHVVNNGYPVVFYDDSGVPVLEADGLVANSVVLLLNEVKHTPTPAHARLQQGRAHTLMGILSDPSAFLSEPAGCLPELARKGIRDVRPVLSGYNFAASVEAACVKEGVLVMKTNGSDCSNIA